jgi:glycosyltransferase involved in cell wall biosynthesis
MRGFLFYKAASMDFTVNVLVVPVAGRNPVPPAGPAAVLPLPGPGDLAAAMPSLLASATWRERLLSAQPLPRPAAAAPATLAGPAIEAAGARPGTPVHVARACLMPLAVAIAERLGSPWATADLDDDDQGLALAAGDSAAAEAYGRLVRTFGPAFRGLAVAAPAEAAAISARHDLATTVVPNAVVLGHPAPGPARATRVRGGASLLFAGNLTYWPNADAAIRLGLQVLPRVRRLVSGPVTVTLAGPHSRQPDLLALTRDPGVRLTGFVPDLEPYYRDADALVAPLAFGAGTRIKLLEAFARSVPVVSSAAAAAGLDVADGTHLLLAASPDDMAAAVARLLASRALRARLTGSAFALVAGSYSHDAVIPRIREFFRAAAAAPGRPAPVPVHSGSNGRS